MITKPMTSTERSARHRAKLKARGPKAVKPFTSAAEIYEALVEQRGITDGFNKALCMEIVDAMIAGNLAEAVRALALLPTPAVRTAASTTVSATQARAKLLELVLNAKAADKFEADQADRSDLQAALARVAALEDEVLHLRGVRPRRLPPPSDKPLRSVDRSATEPTKPASTTKLAADPVKPPAGYDPIVNGLWQPPVAVPAAPVVPSSPPSTPPPARPSEPAWRAWYYNGGGAGSGTFGPTPWSDDSPAQGWIDRLNGKAY